MNNLCAKCTKSGGCETQEMYGDKISKCFEFTSKQAAAKRIFGNPGKANIQAEKELQRQVEQWLRLRGYHRRSESDINTVSGVRGWQVHLKETRRNPILLDILLLGSDGRFTEFELKVPPIRWSGEAQKALCLKYGKPVFTSLVEVINHVEEWEGGAE